VFTGGSAGANLRLWSVDELTGNNRITSCLPTIRPRCAENERHCYLAHFMAGNAISLRIRCSNPGHWVSESLTEQAGGEHQSW
jgi:hypothetical protein